MNFIKKEEWVGGASEVHFWQCDAGQSASVSCQVHRVRGGVMPRPCWHRFLERACVHWQSSVGPFGNVSVSENHHRVWYCVLCPVFCVLCGAANTASGFNHVAKEDAAARLPGLSFWPPFRFAFLLRRLWCRTPLALQRAPSYEASHVREKKSNPPQMKEGIAPFTMPPCYNSRQHT